MALKDTREGRDVLRPIADRTGLARLRAAMAASDPLDGPFTTGQQLTDYSDDPEFAIPPRKLDDPEQQAGQIARQERQT